MEDCDYSIVHRLVELIERSINQVSHETDLFAGDVLVALGIVTGKFAEVMADGEDDDDEGEVYDDVSRN